MFKRALISLSVCLALNAQADDAGNYDRIVVVGTKTENTIMDLPQQVVLIAQEQIANSGATNLSELFANVNGIYVSPDGTSMSLRGMAHDDTLYLIDGKRVNGEYSKSFELKRISTSMIERIEVLKGSASLLYGSDALGGVVNIITKTPEDGLRGDAQLITGEYKTEVDGFVGYANESTELSLFASHMDQNAYTVSEDASIKVMKSGTATSPSELGSSSYWGLLSDALEDSYAVDYDYQYNQQVSTLGGRLGHHFSADLQVTVDLNYMTEERDGDYIATSYATNYTNSSSGNSVMAKNVPAYQLDDNSKFDVSGDLSYQASQDLLLDYQIAYSKYDKDRKIYTPLWAELGYDSEEDSLTSENISTLEYLNQDALASYSFSSKNQLLAGAEYRREDAKSNAFDVDNRNHSAVFLQHEYREFDSFDLIYGARYDLSSDGDGELSLSFGAVYDLLKNTKIKLSYSEAFNTPELRDLYVIQTTPSGATNLGSTVIDEDLGKTTAWELAPETSQNYELALFSQGDWWGFDLTIFKTQVEDLIERSMVDSSYYTFFNVDDAKFKGLETNLTLQPWDNFSAQLSYNRIEATDESDGSDITDTPDSYAGLTLSYWPTDQIELKTITRYTGSQLSSSDEAVDSFVVTNLKAQFKGVVDGLDIFMGLDNIFSEEVPDYLGRIPEVSYYAGLSYQF